MLQRYIENEKFVFFPEGRIIQENVESLDRQLQGLREKHLNRGLVLDASRLDFISSSGLRVLLKLIRKGTRKLTIQNASDAVFTVLDTAGVTDLVHVETPFEDMFSDNAMHKSKARGCAKSPRCITTRSGQVIGMGRSGIV